MLPPIVLVQVVPSIAQVELPTLSIALVVKAVLGRVATWGINEKLNIPCLGRLLSQCFRVTIYYTVGERFDDFKRVFQLPFGYRNQFTVDFSLNVHHCLQVQHDTW